MEVKIRKVDPTIVGRIDQLAKEKGVSREEFLREQLEVISVIDLIKEEQKVVDRATRPVTKMLKETSIKLDEMEDKYLKMVHLISLATGIDMDEMNEFVEARKELLE